MILHIAYCIADIDDAVNKKILSIEELHKELESGFKDDLKETLSEALKRYKAEKHNNKHAYMLVIKTNVTKSLVEYVAGKFIENIDGIFKGEQDKSLLEVDETSYQSKAVETLKKIVREFVFSNTEVEELELKGFYCIKNILEQYSFLLKMDRDDFKELYKNNLHKKYPLETRLYHRISNRAKNAYTRAITTNIDDIEELYFRTRMIIDYVSGMTDTFVLEENHILRGF